jgi:hypothetical protein
MRGFFIIFKIHLLLVLNFNEGETEVVSLKNDLFHLLVNKFNRGNVKHCSDSNEMSFHELLETHLNLRDLHHFQKNLWTVKVHDFKSPFILN